MRLVDSERSSRIGRMLVVWERERAREAGRGDEQEMLTLYCSGNIRGIRRTVCRLRFGR